MNSLMITVVDSEGNESTPVYECHSATKAVEIIQATIELLSNAPGRITKIEAA